jgi:Domain of unknown function (DUF4365)
VVYVAQAGDNSLQGDFGEAWLEAVAAGCGLLHGPSTTLDRQKTDVHLVLEGLWHGTYNPAVNVQVKTTVALREQNGYFAYDLNIATYDVLRRDNESVRRVLVVIGLPKDEERVILHADGTLLVGRGAWVSLEGQSASGNTDTQVIRLPVTNTLDRSGLERMLTTYGVRSSTPVPDMDAWRQS